MAVPDQVLEGEELEDLASLESHVHGVLREAYQMNSSLPAEVAPAPSALRERP